MPESEYIESQLWLFPDMMVFPVREDGVLNGEVLVVPEDSCRSVYGLREMVRAVLGTPQYAQREEKKYQEYVDGMLERYPLATMVDSPDKTVVYFYDAEGRVFGSRRVSTVGNF